MFALLLMERAVRLLVIMSLSPRKRQLYNLRSKHGRRLIFIDTSGGEACGMLIRACCATSVDARARDANFYIRLRNEESRTMANCE